MSKAVDGNPVIDANVKKLIKVLKRYSDHKIAKNLSLDTLSELSMVAATVAAIANRHTHIKIQQSIGGMKGAKRRWNRRTSSSKLS